MNQRGFDPAIIVALDVASRQQAVALAKRLDPTLCQVKVGMELFTAAGPIIVKDLQKLGYKVFLDLKFKDIPNTVAGAVRSACSLGVWMLNVHADGGSKMMRAAVEAVQKAAHPPLLLGVTVLTSMDASDLEEVGVTVLTSMDTQGVGEPGTVALTTSTLPQVCRLAKLVQRCGLDGIVSSGQEIAAIRQQCGEDFLIVVPGIRLPGGSQDDQARIVTPEMAIRAGADYLVVGRPITGAPDAVSALWDFNNRVFLARMEPD